jgi:4-hydroxy-3-methylbut-2-en-1-yl diphosphate reductase
MSEKPELSVVLCSPRGFCAGVTRAIDVVETALKLHGAPVYVRHEIVHNKYVVDSLKAKGAVFVKELDEIPAGDAPLIFSAHGVPKSVPAAAEARRLNAIDATCPLVTKVHREAQAHHKRGRHVILIGHAGHPEVVGTLGQLPQGAITLVAERADVETLQVPEGQEIAFVTQTTLSVDDTRDVIAALKARFPAIQEPPVEDICYATTNRQEAVKAAAGRVDAVIVVGAANSSNSQRLREVAEREGCKTSLLVPNAAALDLDLLLGARAVAVTAGASAPEILVEQILDALAERFRLNVETLTTREENMFFPLPRSLREPASA